MLRLKKLSGWEDDLKQMNVSDLSDRSRNEMLPWYVFLLLMMISVGVIGYTLVQYDLLPEQIPTHWRINGEPDAFTEKNEGENALSIYVVVRFIASIGLVLSVSCSSRPSKLIRSKLITSIIPRSIQSSPLYFQ